MIVKLSLKNSENYALIDDASYNYIIKHPYLSKINFLDNLRIHSNGYAFFQKNWKQLDGSYKCETIYLQKIIAEKFIEKPDHLKDQNKVWIRFINGNPLDCRIKNLEWSTLSNVVRNTSKTENKLGYRGVVKSGKKYQAIIYLNRKAINLGTFDTPEKAALAYNEKSMELFGKTKSLNKVKNNEYKEEFANSV